MVVSLDNCGEGAALRVALFTYHGFPQALTFSASDFLPYLTPAEDTPESAPPVHSCCSYWLPCGRSLDTPNPLFIFWQKYLWLVVASSQCVASNSSESYHPTWNFSQPTWSSEYLTLLSTQWMMRTTARGDRRFNIYHLHQFLLIRWYKRLTAAASFLLPVGLAFCMLYHWICLPHVCYSLLYFMSQLFTLFLASVTLSQPSTQKTHHQFIRIFIFPQQCIKTSFWILIFPNLSLQSGISARGVHCHCSTYCVEGS